MIARPAGIGTKNDCADEDQQQFSSESARRKSLHYTSLNFCIFLHPIKIRTECDVLETASFSILVFQQFKFPKRRINPEIT
jgi:hypothetical protein